MENYLLEFLVLRPVATACAVRQQLRKTLPWAHDLLVVGDGEVLKIHVHTSRPDLAIGVGLACGLVDDVVLEPQTRSWSEADFLANARHDLPPQRRGTAPQPAAV